MFLALDGKVYKYDLVSKECLFEFNSATSKHLSLFDKDNKLLMADQTHIKLWDFFSHRDEMPELVTMLDTSAPIDCIKVNKCCEEHGPHRNVFYYVITCGNEFQIYHGRLEPLLEGATEDPEDKITCIEFGVRNEFLYFGTQKGRVLKYYLPSPQEVMNSYKVEEGELPKGRLARTFTPDERTDYEYTVTLLFRVPGVEDQDLLVLNVRYSGLFIWNEAEDELNLIECPQFKYLDVDKIRATPNGQFLVVGFPRVGQVAFFKVDFERSIATLLEPTISVSSDECLTHMFADQL